MPIKQKPEHTTTAEDSCRSTTRQSGIYLDSLLIMLMMTQQEEIPPLFTCFICLAAGMPNLGRQRLQQIRLGFIDATNNRGNNSLDMQYYHHNRHHVVPQTRGAHADIRYRKA